MAPLLRGPPAAVGAEGPQALERPDAPGVAVRPVRLQGVVADRIDGLQNERVGAVALRETAGHPAEEIGLAGADRAGAGAAERLERVVGFVAVVPHDDEEITENLI